MEITITIKLDDEMLKKLLKEELKSEKEITLSKYSRIFDDRCAQWSKGNSVYNRTFLIRQQQYANDVLRNRGYVFLNEIYDALGIPKSSEGQVVGWVYKDKDPIGDNFIDFDIKELDDGSFSLDFNVDGNIIGYL